MNRHKQSIYRQGLRGIYANLFFTLIFAVVITFLASDNSFASDKVKSSITPAELNIKKGKDTLFNVIVEVPQNNHAYVNEGDEGYFIPVTINFSLPQEGITILPVSKPDGARDNEVKAQVLRGVGVYSYSIKWDKGDVQTIPVTVMSQMCNDESKICFPPQKEDLTLIFSEGKTQNSSLDKNNMSFGEWVTATYQENSQNIFVAFFIVLLAGLLAAATPCVYPMMPITYAILTARGNGDKREGWFHSVAYFVGIVITYFMLGFVAGMTGGMLSSIMQSASVNIFLALFFLMFALAMFDFFSFSFFDELSEKVNSASSKKSSYFGTILMGVAAGIIVSPCVGPVIFSILLQIADKIAELTNVLVASGEQITFMKKAEIALQGSIVMAGFGIGLGIPFLLIGTIGNKLPRSGMWMVYVKYALGIIILYIAYIYLYKGLGAAGIDVEVYNGGIIGGAFIIAAGYLIFKEKQNYFQNKFSLISSVVLLVVGLYAFSITMNHFSDKRKSLSTEAGSSVEEHGNLKWYRSYDNALQEAKRLNQPVFIDFFAYWCANCIAFADMSLTNKDLNKALEKTVLLKVYDTDKAFEEYKKIKSYRELNVGLPFFVVLKPDGTFFWKTTQYNAVSQMINKLEEAAK
ncbi:MAG: sulfite exporter TauE/SafE family protein [Nitrospinae bacterium]|nr:sulfite exporter TauE/SafE family protein [Nitrospinota bacterium]